MPEGVRGFQKGRKKTGGRIKGVVEAARRSSKFIEQLKGYGFNYPSELAQVFKELKTLRETLASIPLTGDKTKDFGALEARNALVKELQFYYNELKALLPYMAPKLREKEILVEELSEPAVPGEAPAKPVSDDELLNILNDGKKDGIDARPSHSDRVEKRDSELPVSAGSDEDLPNVAGEQEENE